MLTRFVGVPTDAILVQVCDRQYCGAMTIHGPLARLKWAWTDEQRLIARPEVVCRICGTPCEDTFALQAIEG